MVELGAITQEEADFIRARMSRKGALENLFITLGRVKNFSTDVTAVELYERIVLDMQQVNDEVSKWWEDTAKKYGWDYGKENIWSVDFNDNKVFLS